MKSKYIMLLILLLPVWGCYSEAPITVPEDQLEYGYSVPQGDNPYDDRIVEWNRAMDGKLFILYRFAPRDVYWNNTQWDGMLEGGVFPGSSQLAYDITQAQEQYVEEQFNFIDEYFLSFYPVDFLKGKLPQKILLAGTIEKYEIQSPGSAPTVTDEYIYMGFDNFTIKGGDGQIGSMTREEKVGLAKAINVAYFNYVVYREGFEVPQAFIDLADGYPVVEFGDYPFYYGFLSFIPTVTDENKARADFAMYLGAALETDEMLNMVNDYPAVTTMPQYEGIFYYDPERVISISTNPWLPPIVYTGIGKDRSGKIKQKFDIMVEYMLDAYGIDLTAMSQKINSIQ